MISAGLPEHILHLFRTDLDTAQIALWLRRHDGLNLSEAEVVRLLHRAIERERALKSATEAQEHAELRRIG